ncbi:hypothetical protein HHI36_018321 [Cryptolaemus montrouzieri]|uniref:Uncharacterized protein n=1 Tax=Cryptolaemus montrouzieri TaxID=559131 RepID=A0ABD2NZZ3_9CUCU
MDDLIIAKYCVALLLGVIRFSVVCVPIKIYNVIHEKESVASNFFSIVHQDRYNFLMAAFHSFGAGVMLCTCLIHLVTSVHTSIAEEFKGEITSPCQYAQVLICIGFFLVYFIEEIGQWVITKVPSKPFIRTPEYSNSVSSTSNTVISTISNHMIDFQKLKPIAIEKTASEEDESCMSETPNIVVINKKEFVRFLFTEAAVGVHAIFEGLSIGLQCKVINIIYLSIGMTIHSITTLVCLGLNLIIGRAPKSTIFRHFSVLAVLSPAAVLLGMGMNMAGKDWDKRKVNTYMEALSAGNITYITFFEVLSKEKKKRCNKLYRNLFIVIGFALMCYLEYFTFDNSDHMNPFSQYWYKQ